MNILSRLNELHEKLWQRFDRQITSGTRDPRASSAGAGAIAWDRDE
jgi:uncharacterized membrane protein